MDPASPSPESKAAAQDVLGFLNFASSSLDPKFFRAVNEIYRGIEADLPKAPSWQVFTALLRERLVELEASSATFRDAEQARAVIELAVERVLPAYVEHHRDLLFHQSPENLFRPFFIGRVLEAVLLAGPPWDETDRIVTSALHRLNDYLGYRPVAVLETDQKIEPYPHERVRPVPLYIAGAGVAVGRYEELIQTALTILRETDSTVLDAASFDPELLNELAYDPRAYDFNHPVNKRPNYHFGLWDPHHIDNHGRYRRFVIQQVTLDALLERVDERDGPPRSERLFEAAAVLAGTILMASGTSGSGPETHDSSTTLTSLLPRIAAYRDAFYTQLIARVPGEHGARLKTEAARLRQPFAAARQHLNQQLARRRAAQLQQVALALIFARLGYPEAAMRQAREVAVPSARILCEIQCRLTEGLRAARLGDARRAAEYLPQIEDLLHRGIECGAIIDPWNIIGFGGQFSVFAAIENSVPDPRVDELIDLMEEIFAFYSRVWSEAAATENEALQKTINDRFLNLASWWDRFAVPMVSSVKRLFGMELLLAAEFVAHALSDWKKGGAAAGDTAFWRPHAEQFDSPKAYTQVLEALLQRGDYVASMALLMHWLGQAERVKLEDGDSSFHRLTMRWINLVLSRPDGDREGSSALSADPDRLAIVRKFLDYVEANAETYWEVPQLEIDAQGADDLDELLDDDDEDEDADDLFGAAYEDVTYRDSTSDGFEGEMLEFGSSATDYELDHESKRLARRLAFLMTLARVWKVATIAHTMPEQADPRFSDSLRSWHAQARTNRLRLAQLMRAVHARQIPAPSTAQESLVEYDRRRMVKESLLEKLIATTVATWDAERVMRAAMNDQVEPSAAGADESESSDAPLEQLTESSAAVTVLRSLTSGNVAGLRSAWPRFLVEAAAQPLLYVSLSKGGDPLRIVAARSWQQLIRQLLAWLPRGGFLRETCQLIKTARKMEKDHPLGAGAVTEFDRLYEIGFKAIVEATIDASANWEPSVHHPTEEFDGALIECLRHLTETLLAEWLTHSRTLRLSVLEKITSDNEWTALVGFIQRYGFEVFTQKFLNLGNLRAILHQGVESWLTRLIDDRDRPEWQLLDDVDRTLPKGEAAQYLSMAIEAVVENYSEYRDYNSTTTQSDRGDMLYMFLDFLRLKANYERVNWNLRPVVMTHEVLIRRGRNEEAEIWRRAMAERTADAADQHLKSLGELQAKYGMRLATVADRLAERFVRPLAIDRIQALVKPAVEEARKGLQPTAFSLLAAETAELAGQPSGAGFELPDWLASLEEEVERAVSSDGGRGDIRDKLLPPLRVQLSLDEIQSQLTDWEQGALPEK